MDLRMPVAWRLVGWLLSACWLAAWLLGCLAAWLPGWLGIPERDSFLFFLALIQSVSMYEENTWMDEQEQSQTKK